uniref:EF-hand domain-containing protein n=1 Tax=Pyrodinium bahamense TaxID=73915 RepID=A0A7S0B218_9DINO
MPSRLPERVLPSVLRPVTSLEREDDGNSSRSSDEGTSDEFERQSQTGFCLAQILESRLCTVIVMGLIAGNTLVIVLEAHDPHWPGWEPITDVFTAFFTVEILLRLWVSRWSFFTDPREWGWNLFDLGLVVIGVAEALSTLFSNIHGVFGFFRAIRVIRILRICRVMRQIKSLTLLMEGFLHFLSAEFYIFVLFVYVVFIAALVCTTIVGDHAKEVWDDASESDIIEFLFGNLLKSMVTMFQLVTLDDWVSIVKLVGTKMPIMFVFLLCYILITAFAMIALLTGVMTECINRVSSRGEKQEEEREFARYVATLEGFFRGHGTGEDAGLTLAEFAELLQKQEVAEHIHLHQASTACGHEELADIFKSLDLNFNGRVSWDEFLRGLRYVQGPASARQLCLLRAELNRILRYIQDLGAAPRKEGAVGGESELRGRMDAVEGRLKRLESRLVEYTDKMKSGSFWALASSPPSGGISSPASSARGFGA